jgi:hypothetical protein
MKTRYRLIRRGVRGGGFYCVDSMTGKRTSLRTGSEDEARQIVEAKNQAERQPMLNLQIAKAYLAGTDNGITTRTWQQAIEALTNTKQEANRERWLRVVKDRALAPLLPRIIIETPGELLLRVLQTGTVSTNVYLRRLHNFCVDMNWLPWPLVPKRQWPVVRFKDKRAITWEEHCRILAREVNPERKYSINWSGISARRNRTWRTCWPKMGTGLTARLSLVLREIVTEEILNGGVEFGCQVE